MNPLALALVFQVGLLAYHQVTTLCDFFPFNGVRFSTRRERLLEAGFNLLLMGAPPIGFVLGARWLMEFGAAYYVILFVVECVTWWAPYFFGPSPKWREVYARMHRLTITIVPRRGDNPAPNLEHMILMVLTLATAIVTLAAYRASPGPHFAHWIIIAAIGAVLITGATYQTCLEGRGKSGGGPAV